MKCNTSSVTERRIDGSCRSSNKTVSESVRYSRAKLTVLGDFRSDPSNRPTQALGPWRGESTARTFIACATWSCGSCSHHPWCCLLYTSDAADERSSVDLGGRRIIKK